MFKTKRFPSDSLHILGVKRIIGVCCSFFCSANIKNKTHGMLQPCLTMCTKLIVCIRDLPSQNWIWKLKIAFLLTSAPRPLFALVMHFHAHKHMRRQEKGRRRIGLCNKNFDLFIEYILFGTPLTRMTSTHWKIQKPLDSQT